MEWAECEVTSLQHNLATKQPHLTRHPGHGLEIDAFGIIVEKENTLVVKVGCHAQRNRVVVVDSPQACKSVL